MQQTRQHSFSSLDAIRIDFMDVYYDIHQRETETKKRTKAKRRYQARKGIEDYMEKKRLEAQLKEWWDEI